MSHTRSFSLPAACLLMLACTGCWEEIHQVPGEASLSTPPKAQESHVDAAEEDQYTSPITEAISSSSSDPPPSNKQTPPTISNADIPLQTGASTSPPELDWLDEKSALPTTNVEVVPIPPTRTAVAAWRMGSKWSLAAAYYAKGLGADRYREPLDQANYAARLLDLDLPALPVQPEAAVLQQTVVHHLLHARGPQVLEQLAERFPPDHAALAELALKTHLLLLVYTPTNQQIEPLITSIRQAAANSGLPENLWRETVDLLQQRAEFARVKQAVFQLHSQAAEYLAGSSPSAKTEN